tara:strand:+ start:23 stop:502 length:480 start_codon:yes stop_codon:yes gene_type:complete
MAFTLLKPTGIDLSQNFAFTGSVSGAGGGKILQLVSQNYQTETSTNSSTYGDTGLTVNITPSATSSKVLVMVAMGMGYTSNGTESRFKLLRDSTDLSEFIRNLGLDASGGGSALNYLDTPNTLAQKTYKVQFKRNSGSGNCYVCVNDSGATITAMEIGA